MTATNTCVQSLARNVILTLVNDLRSTHCIHMLADAQWTQSAAGQIHPQIPADAEWTQSAVAGMHKWVAVDANYLHLGCNF